MAKITTEFSASEDTTEGEPIEVCPMCERTLMTLFNLVATNGLRTLDCEWACPMGGGHHGGVKIMVGNPSDPEGGASGNL